MDRDPSQNYAVMWASTSKIGDDIQTLAAINFLKKKGIEKYSFIDREYLSDYDGDAVNLIMNGWFMHNLKKFPPSKNINPIFISFHVNKEKLVKKTKNTSNYMSQLVAEISIQSNFWRSMAFKVILQGV